MKQNKLKKGFTLLEVMIALAVLSISMLGIYSLQNMSLKTLISAKEKMFVIERGYDRISRQINFPNKAYEEVEDYNGTLVYYSFLKESSGVPMVQKITMTISTSNASTTFVYYEKPQAAQSLECDEKRLYSFRTSYCCSHIFHCGSWCIFHFFIYCQYA